MLEIQGNRHLSLWYGVPIQSFPRRHRQDCDRGFDPSRAEAARRTPLGNPGDGTAAAPPAATSANVPTNGPSAGKPPFAARPAGAAPGVADAPSENSPPAPAGAGSTPGMGSSQADPILL